MNIPTIPTIPTPEQARAHAKSYQVELRGKLRDGIIYQLKTKGWAQVDFGPIAPDFADELLDEFESAGFVIEELDYDANWRHVIYPTKVSANA